MIADAGERRPLRRKSSIFTTVVTLSTVPAADPAAGPAADPAASVDPAAAGAANAALLMFACHAASTHPTGYSIVPTVDALDAFPTLSWMAISVSSGALAAIVRSDARSVAAYAFVAGAPSRAGRRRRPQNARPGPDRRERFCPLAKKSAPRCGQCARSDARGCVGLGRAALGEVVEKLLRSDVPRELKRRPVALNERSCRSRRRLNSARGERRIQHIAAVKVATAWDSGADVHLRNATQRRNHPIERRAIQLAAALPVANALNRYRGDVLR